MNSLSRWPSRYFKKQKKEAKMEKTMYFLDQKDMPTRWYNIQADLPEPLPPVLHPGTGQPVGPADLAPLFPTGGL